MKEETIVLEIFEEDEKVEELWAMLESEHAKLEKLQKRFNKWLIKTNRVLRRLAAEIPPPPPIIPSEIVVLTKEDDVCITEKYITQDNIDKTLDIKQRKYEALRAHIGDVYSCFEDLSEKYFTDKKDVYVKNLVDANKAMQDEPVFKIRSNPKTDEMIDDVVQWTGSVIRFAVGLLTIGVSETYWKLGENISGFFSGKQTHTEKCVNEAGKLLTRSW